MLELQGRQDIINVGANASWKIEGRLFAKMGREIFSLIKELIFLPECIETCLQAIGGQGGEGIWEWDERGEPKKNVVRFLRWEFLLYCLRGNRRLPRSGIRHDNRNTIEFLHVSRNTACVQSRSVVDSYRFMFIQGQYVAVLCILPLSRRHASAMSFEQQVHCTSELQPTSFIAYILLHVESSMLLQAARESLLSRS